MDNVSSYFYSNDSSYFYSNDSSYFLVMFLVILVMFYYFFSNILSYFCEISLNDQDKESLINTISKIKCKSINCGDIKNALNDFEPKHQKLLPICKEVINKIYETLPDNKDAPKRNIRSRMKTKKYQKFITPKLTIYDVEQIMSNNCKEAPDDLDNFVFVDDFVLSEIKVQFKSDPITRIEFLEAFKAQLEAKKDFMGISKMILYNLTPYLQQRIINVFNSMIWGDASANVTYHAIGKGYLVYKEAKKGPVDDINSFRTITTIPLVVNHCHRILSKRITDYFIHNGFIDLTINKGSMPNIRYGILEQIIKLRNMISDSVENKKEMNLLFVDISDAFPSLSISKLVHLLKKYNVDSHITKYIENYYNNLDYTISITRNNTTHMKKWGRGLIQGCPMSPILFVIVINHILKTLNDRWIDKYGYDFNGIKILFTAYMDDICILTNSMEGLALIYDDLKMILSDFSLKINSSKTKIMTRSQKQVVGLSDIEYVKEFKYLGETITCDGNLEANYKEMFRMLYKRLYKIDKASYCNETKIGLFQEYILPWIQRKLITFYDLETEYKGNLCKIIVYFLNKWGYKDSVKLFNTIASALGSSDDPYIKQIIKSVKTTKCDHETSQLTTERRMIRYKFSYDQPLKI